MGGPLKCRNCVAQAATEERRAADKRRRQREGGGGDTIAAAAAAEAATPLRAPGVEVDGSSDPSSLETPRECASCHATLNAAAYSRSQWSRGDGVSRCRPCVDAAEDAVANEGPSVRHLEAMEKARRAVDEAKSSGDARAILAAESVVAALEAERVTGLKPVRLGGGGRGGRGRGRGGYGSRTGARGRGLGRAASGR